jgi:hypothetical protein
MYQNGMIRISSDYSEERFSVPIPARFSRKICSEMDNTVLSALNLSFGREMKRITKIIVFQVLGFDVVLYENGLPFNLN